MDELLPERARVRVPGEEPSPTRRLPRRLLESWRRSEEYGVPLEAVEPGFTGSFDRDSLFVECGSEVLGALHRTLHDEPISLMLTDAEGVVLSRLSGDASLLRSLDAVHLAPGFAYSEREVGTNGLGLALADRAPTLVRASEHYSLGLCSYTCAAVPVLDPSTGHMAGSVNLTTWSESSSELLLALAQSAAGNTAALMLARADGRRSRPVPRGEVFRVEPARLEPGAGTTHALCAAWTTVAARARDALARGEVVAALGEPGSGRTTLLAQAGRHHRPRGRILAAAPPGPADAESWLALWSPEVGRAETTVVVRDVDLLPASVAERLRDLLQASRRAGEPAPFAFTTAGFADIPAPLAALVDTVLDVPPLRERVADIPVLVQHASRRLRSREIGLTAPALHALENHDWPGNVAELVTVVKNAAAHTETIDLRHLPASILTGSSRKLSRIESFERDEIIRVLTQDGMTMKRAADELGMSRATVYRKLGQLDIRLPRS